MLEGLVKIILLPVTALISVLSPGNPSGAIQITPTPTPTNNIVATGTIAQQNITVDISVTTPPNGGNVAGTVSGICDGTITGQYDGQQNGAISGNITATCGTLFIKIDGTGTFTGKVSKTTGEMPFSYSVTGNNQTITGSSTLHFTPVQ